MANLISGTSTTGANMPRNEDQRPNQSIVTQLFIAMLLIAGGVALRLYFRYIPNFAPVAALALFAGFYFRSWTIALLVPVSVMLISDQVIGGYSWPLMVTVYAMLGLPIAMRSLLRRNVQLQPSNTSRRVSISRVTKTSAVIAGSCLGASLLFFAVTNLAVWQFTSLYESSFSGLSQCFASALPFFRYTLLGDLTFATALFGGYALILQASTIQARRASELAQQA